MEIGVERLAIAFRDEARETRIPEPSARIPLQSETDGGPMAEVEQDAKHGLPYLNLEWFFQSETRLLRSFRPVFTG